MERRLTALRKQMADDGVDAVLFTSYHNINYYSDFLFTSFGRNYALVVTQDNATTISANIDAGQPWRRSFGDNLVYTDWRRDNYVHAVPRAGQRRACTAAGSGVEDDHIPRPARPRSPAPCPGWSCRHRRRPSCGSG